MTQFNFPLPSGYGWQYHLLLWVQSLHSPWLDKAAKLLSYLGTEGFYVIAVSVLLWGVNRVIGVRVAYVFLVSMTINATLKEMLAVIRPIGIPGIRSMMVSSANGYAMPAGHAQGPMTFWVLVSLWLRKGWVWGISLTLMALIGVGRLYLGLHWPLDILVGWGLGLAFAFIGWGLGRWWTYRAYPFSGRVIAAIAVPLSLLVLHRGTEAIVYSVLLLGLGLGAVLEEHWLRLEMGREWWKRVCAVLIGIAGLIALQWILRWIPVTTRQPVLALLAGLWGTLGAPWVFELCGLYTRQRGASD